MTRLFIVLTLITLAGFFLLRPVERLMVYPFDATRVPPAKAGVPALTEVTLTSGTETLILWIAPAKKGRPTILYFHGNAGNLAGRAGRFRHFLSRGYGLIAPAYRGSSGSSGTPSQDTLTADAALIYRALGSLIPGLTPERTVLYGESLGTGVAVALMASADPPAGLILEAPYTSLPDVAAHAYPALAPLTKLMVNRWDSLSSAAALTRPLLILHGTADTLIPIGQGRQLYAAAPAKDKQFVTVKAGTHNALWRSDTLPVMWRFLDGYLLR